MIIQNSFLPGSNLCAEFFIMVIASLLALHEVRKRLLNHDKFIAKRSYFILFRNDTFL